MNRRRFARLIEFSLIPVLAACSGSDGATQPATVDTGPVSRAEFLSLPNPTYARFTSVYEEIQATFPGIEADETRLRRELYNRLKKLSSASVGSTTASIAQAAPLSDDVLSTLGIKLTDEEKAIVYDYPRSSGQTLLFIYPNAFSISESTFNCGLGATRMEQLNDNKTDAFRHAYWNARMTRDLSLDFAEKIATAHEAEKSSLRARMDLHNNKFGRELALRYPSATDLELQTILAQAQYVFVRDGDAFPDPKSALVFFTQKQTLDATLAGSITNPDSGGPWQLSVAISQCGQIVRGIMTLVRGASQQQRRFSGTVAATTLSLQIDNPFVFENPQNLAYCANMKTNLSGAGTTYNGPWTSSNCSLGGVIAVTNRSP